MMNPVEKLPEFARTDPVPAASLPPCDCQALVMALASCDQPDSAMLGTVLDALRNGATLPTAQFRQLARLLVQANDETIAWLLLNCLTFGPRECMPAEHLFRVLARLVQSASPFIRQAACQHLAQLHTLDLRFEARAKRVICQVMNDEAGVARDRLQALLRRC